MLGRIGIHLTQDHTCERRMDIGLQLAAAHGAQAVGIYPAASVAGLQQDEHREATRALFLEKARAAHVDSQWRCPGGDVDDALALHARFCDLLVMSKVDSSDQVSSLRPNLPEAVIMAAGRPVLMIPNHGQFNTIGQRILYCWDHRREAARAFTDAAPLLRQCQSLVVLEVDRNEKLAAQYDLQDGDLAQYCRRLGYPDPQHLVRDSTGYGVGNVILNTATDTDRDLIVMGAYGHSRMRQWIMGGATSTLLANMTIPVLLAN